MATIHSCTLPSYIPSLAPPAAWPRPVNWHFLLVTTVGGNSLFMGILQPAVPPNVEYKGGPSPSPLPLSFHICDFSIGCYPQVGFAMGISKSEMPHRMDTNLSESCSHSTVEQQAQGIFRGPNKWFWLTVFQNMYLFSLPLVAETCETIYSTSCLINLNLHF